MEDQLTAEEINIWDYWEATKRAWRIWLGSGLIAAISAGIWSCCIQPTRYQASASIVATAELPPDYPQAISTMASALTGLAPGVGTEAELCKYILQTRETRCAVVKQCNLQQVLRASSATEASRRLEKWTKVKLERPNIARLEITLPGRPRVVEALAKEARREAAELAAQIANSYIKALHQQLSELHLAGAKRRRIFLEEQKQQVETELNRAAKELQQWEAEHKAVDVDEASKLAMQRLMNIEEQRELARVELAATRQRTRGLRQKLAEQPEAETATVVHQANPLVGQLRERLVTLESKLAVAKDAEGKSEQHPEVRKIQRELEATRQALAQEQQQEMLKASSTEVANPVAKKLQEELALEEVAITATEARIEGLGKALRRGEQQVVGLSEGALEYSRLVRKVRTKQAIFEALAGEYERALIEEQNKEPVFRVIDAPVAPEYPAGPNVANDMSLAGAMGVLIGWVWIMARGVRRKAEGGGDEKSR